MKCRSILFFGFFLSSQLLQAQSISYFPGKGNWETKSPSLYSIDSVKLNQAIRFAIDNETKFPKNLRLTQAMQFGKEPFSDPIGPLSERGEAAGLIVYKGYIIASWGNPTAVEMSNSVTKSLLSIAVGLAVEKGMIASIDDKVAPYLPPVEMLNNPESTDNPLTQKSFIYPFETPHNRKITWNHLLRQTSDWEGVLWGKPDWADRPSDKTTEWTTRARNEPGTTYKYNDTRVNALALATTLVWHKPLPEVIRENIMNPIGASNTWIWTGYKNAWIVLDGKMIQSVSGGGHYGGGLFINSYDMARFGLLTLRKGNWKGTQLINQEWIKKSTTPTAANPEYGFMNYFLNQDKKLLPSAPASAFVHIGNGNNIIYVDMENDLVVVARWIENNSMDEFFKKLLSSMPTKK